MPTESGNRKEANHDNHYNDLTLLPYLSVDDSLEPRFSGLLDAEGRPLIRKKEIGFIHLKENK